MEIKMAETPTIEQKGDDLRKPPEELVFRPINSQNLFEETVGRLGQAIKTGVVPIGDRFPNERDLAEILGVSRPTVREAIRALQQAGYVEVRRGRSGGAFVVSVGGKRATARRLAKDMGSELGSILDYRWAIEPAIAELAATRADDDDVESLQTLAQQQGDPADADVFRADDTRIHLAIADVARSPSLATSASEIRLQLSELLAAIPVLEESARHSQDQHAAIIKAISRRDGVAARKAMLEHVNATAELLHGLN
jgi:DNA-binding FadR family transcriptional regulator